VEEMIDLRGPQQGLRWDAAPVEADAAQLVALDDRGLHPELRRPDRRDIAAGSATDDNEVERSLRHPGTPSVIPAKAEIQGSKFPSLALDPRLRGGDG